MTNVTVSNPTRWKSAQEERPPGLVSSSVWLGSNVASTMTARDIDPNKRADKLSTDEGNKIATVLNNSCQFKMLSHMLNRNRGAQDTTVVYDVTSRELSSNVMDWVGEINKYVFNGVNMLLVENKCDLTSHKMWPTDEAKELADSPSPKHE